MREMRRKERAITEEESLDILHNGDYGVLSTVTENGKPYGVPLNFYLIDNSLYFHCALEGQKIDNIEQNKFVSFCVVGKTELLPDKFSTKYESVVVSGEAEEVFDKEKLIALEGLLQRYSAEYFEKGIHYIERLKDKTRVFKIIINKITGKARKQ